MSRMFMYTEWGDRKPEEIEKAENGKLLVSRNVHPIMRDGNRVYVGELAIMDEAMYGAYVGARDNIIKREQDIIDETILNLIDEGSL